MLKLVLVIAIHTLNICKFKSPKKYIVLYIVFYMSAPKISEYVFSFKSFQQQSTTDHDLNCIYLFSEIQKKTQNKELFKGSNRGVSLNSSRAEIITENKPCCRNIWLQASSNDLEHSLLTSKAACTQWVLASLQPLEVYVNVAYGAFTKFTATVIFAQIFTSFRSVFRRCLQCYKHSSKLGWLCVNQASTFQHCNVSPSFLAKQLINRSFSSLHLKIGLGSGLEHAML